MESQVVTKQRPLSLGKRPIVDAVFEIRVRSHLPLSSVLPGIIYTSLKADGIEQTPAMQIPKQVRDLQPELAFAPLFRISWGQHWVFVGDNVLSISSKLPYSGWGAFRQAIQEVLSVVCTDQYISAVDRCSMKYIDLIQTGDELDRREIFDLELSIGGKYPGREGYQVRVEFVEHGIHHVVQVVSHANLELINIGPVQGAVFDADLVLPVSAEPPSIFIEALDLRLENLHTAIKDVFFDSLTDKGLEWLEPNYA